jgi:hypothetical protein
VSIVTDRWRNRVGTVVGLVASLVDVNKDVNQVYGKWGLHNQMSKKSDKIICHSGLVIERHSPLLNLALF